MSNRTCMEVLRSRRDMLLAESDWTQFNDSPLTESKKTEWATYRQKLRDLPKDNPDPKFQLVKDPYPKDHLMYGTDLEDKESLPDITWPTKPSE